jgi:nucleotide sugar dehydrogenase
LGRIADREITIGVVGLGYVGLPTALLFFESGYRVIGIDSCNSVVSLLKEGKNPIGDSEFDDKIPPRQEKNWIITSSYSDSIKLCDVVIVTVPTPVTSDKDLDERNVLGAGESIFQNIPQKSGKIIVLESTVYPGFTRKIWSPIVLENGLILGEDVHIAYCPERYNPGDKHSTIAKTTRIVGSMSDEVGEFLASLYSSISEVDVIHVGSMEVAESSKLIENVQRDINIALVNELSMILPSLGIDIEEVLDAASTKWNFHRYFPGIGVGGHCIPVDPYFLIDQANEKNNAVQLISTARLINDQMPKHVSDLIVEIMRSHNLSFSESSILVMGWSYKPNIGDIRGSPSLDLARILSDLGIAISVLDPFVPKKDLPDFVKVVDDIDQIKGFDMIVMATAHDFFQGINWGDILSKMSNNIIFDGRRCLDLEELRQLGWSVYALGKP